MFQKPPQAAYELSRALRAHRRQCAETFAAALEPTPKWKQMMDENRQKWDSFVQSEFFVFVDYLAEYFSRGDETFKQLFIGEKIKSLYDANLDDAARKTQIEAVGVAERCGLEIVLQRQISSEAWDLLDSQLSSVNEILSKENVNTQRALLVGDCLFLDILPFIVGDLLAAGITVLPDYATSKNIHELHAHLRQLLSTRKFDLVFYSPFSYEFSPEYTQLTNWRNAIMTAKAVHMVAEKAWSEASTTLNLVADLSDCPIYVHNSSAIIRDENVMKRFLKLKATARVRTVAREQVNAMISKYIDRKNSTSFKHLFVMDELAMVRKAGEMQAGAYHYRTELQHPALLGRILAQRYVDIIFVNVHLLKKKLIVCDLDNTLWDGVIGEGFVSHYHERQKVLQELKSKGIVLAINSKNDPANIHWQGATLSADDFVCAAISWEPKVQSMKRIQEDLNMKMKDFVFIDDREDEIQLMRTMYPEVLCLDATKSDTWLRLGLWKDCLDDEQDMDRTLMYKQREKRKAFVIEDASSEEEKIRLFQSLRIKLVVTQAKSGVLKRVSELINRTNQFNLAGSRTSFKEVSEWHQSSNHLIITGQTADQFGDMGTTCIAVVRTSGADMELLVFVLSCRVFGYGIEQGVMNHLKERAARAGLQRIVGRYVPTPHNAPCKDFLAKNGFKEEGDLWIFLVDFAPCLNADWLEVVVA